MASAGCARASGIRWGSSSTTPPKPVPARLIGVAVQHSVHAGFGGERDAGRGMAWWVDRCRGTGRQPGAGAEIGRHAAHRLARRHPQRRFLLQLAAHRARGLAPCLGHADLPRSRDLHVASRCWRPSWRYENDTTLDVRAAARRDVPRRQPVHRRRRRLHGPISCSPTSRSRCPATTPSSRGRTGSTTCTCASS